MRSCPHNLQLIPRHRAYRSVVQSHRLCTWPHGMFCSIKPNSSALLAASLALPVCCASRLPSGIGGFHTGAWWLVAWSLALGSASLLWSFRRTSAKWRHPSRAAQLSKFTRQGLAAALDRMHTLQALKIRTTAALLVPFAMTYVCTCRGCCPPTCTLAVSLHGESYHHFLAA